MNERRLSVLAVQEAHLTDERIDMLNSCFGTKLKIIGSASCINPTAAGGVAFIVPGRAMMLTLPWGKTRTLNILNVYAPNNTSENAGFWTNLNERWERDRSFRPDVVLGDFNVVESAMDRLPSHCDPERAVQALGNFVRRTKVADTWRKANPTSRVYTYLHSGTGVHSPRP
ncbi:hypothetical protein FKP32DRAFT_1613341 [Trametes sanguinea]|nr:hypothetical protein FKP32DRAFT_1613341 [Trametes sanguinea]